VKGVGVEETLKGVTKLVFKSLSTKYGTDAAPAAAPRPAAAPAAPPVPPVRPRAASGVPAPRPVAPPVSHGTDELLDELDLTPAPDAGGFAEAPELTFEDEEAPVPMPPISMPAAPVNSRPDPKSTMISNRPDPADLRRRLVPTPPELDMDLEHLGDGEQPLEEVTLDDGDPLSALSPDDTAPPRSRAVPPLPSRAPEPAPRTPVAAAPAAPPTSITVEVAPGQQQVDVPIEIKLPRAAGEVRVNLRMVIRSS